MVFHRFLWRDVATHTIQKMHLPPRNPLWILSIQMNDSKYPKYFVDTAPGPIELDVVYCNTVIIREDLSRAPGIK